MAEQGIVAPTGPAHVGRLATVIEGDNPFTFVDLRGGRRTKRQEDARMIDGPVDIGIDKRRDLPKLVPAVHHRG